jgi:hypothetical protein
MANQGSLPQLVDATAEDALRSDVSVTQAFPGTCVTPLGVGERTKVNPESLIEGLFARHDTRRIDRPT